MKRKSRIYVVIGAINLALIAFAILANTVFMQEMWIDHRADPGGPLGYLAANSAVWYQTMGSICGLLVTFIGDALMVSVLPFHRTGPLFSTDLPMLHRVPCQLLGRHVADRTVLWYGGYGCHHRCAERSPQFKLFPRPNGGLWVAVHCPLRRSQPCVDTADYLSSPQRAKAPSIHASQ